MTRHGPPGLTLLDSQRHGAGCELLLVEGESAASAVAAVRDARTQAVLACQGKPLNAWRARPGRVAAHPLYARLAAAMGWPSATDAGADARVDADATPPPALADVPRFERLLLLFDPDADGIHIGALLLLYVQRHAPGLLARGRVWQLRAPLGALRLRSATTGELRTLWADTPQQWQALRQHAASGAALALHPGGDECWQPLAATQFRGLASLPPDVLRATCLDPTTRRAEAVTPAQLRAVIAAFGGAAR